MINSRLLFIKYKILDELIKFQRFLKVTTSFIFYPVKVDRLKKEIHGEKNCVTFVPGEYFETN